MSRFFRRRKYCRFTAEGITEVDYKDVELLKAYITETGSLVTDAEDSAFRLIDQLSAGTAKGVKSAFSDLVRNSD